MSNVNCSDCGNQLPDVKSGPCPKCGSINKTVQLQSLLTRGGHRKRQGIVARDHNAYEEK
jgi:hypothetical protein